MAKSDLQVPFGLIVLIRLQRAPSKIRSFCRRRSMVVSGTMMTDGQTSSAEIVNRLLFNDGPLPGRWVLQRGRRESRIRGVKWDLDYVDWWKCGVGWTLICCKNEFWMEEDIGLLKLCEEYCSYANYVWDVNGVLTLVNRWCENVWWMENGVMRLL